MLLSDVYWLHCSTHHASCHPLFSTDVTFEHLNFKFIMTSKTYCINVMEDDVGRVPSFIRVFDISSIPE